MELLLEISDAEVGTGLPARTDKPYQLRRAARAVIFNDKNQIALLHVSNAGYYKLPGGGIEAGEQIADALQREAKEEIGYAIRVTGEVGIIIEYRNERDELQISYCYLAQVAEGDGETAYEAEEIDEGMKPIWVDLDEAIKLVEESEPDVYVGKFIRLRDATLLKRARELVV